METRIGSSQLLAGDKLAAHQRTSARPAGRHDFEIVIICALPLESDAVGALFDHDWEGDGPPYDKAPGDPNAYSTGTIGRHNVVLAHMPGMGTANSAAVAAHCQSSFPNIKLALVVGICGAIPFKPDSGEEIVLGDVIISDGVVQYDFGRQLPDRFVRKDTLVDSLGRPNTEIRTLLAKLKTIRGRRSMRSKVGDYLDKLQSEPELCAKYPGIAHDVLFDPMYQHIGNQGLCEDVGCSGMPLYRQRLAPGDECEPVIHFGMIASGSTVMKSGQDRDTVAAKEGVIAFEMESAGVWHSFPCVVIKGVCDYADSHKSKRWQRYAAATAAACMKAFLDHWTPSLGIEVAQPLRIENKPCHSIPFHKNQRFVGRGAILDTLREKLLSRKTRKLAIVGLGGVGKTQVALQFAYWVQEHMPEYSTFWVPALSDSVFEQGYTEIAKKLGTLEIGKDEVVKDLVRRRLSSDKATTKWLLIVDNADSIEAMLGTRDKPGLCDYLPEKENSMVLFTSRTREVAIPLAGNEIINLGELSPQEGRSLLERSLVQQRLLHDETIVAEFFKALTYLPLALTQAVAYINRNQITMQHYLKLLRNTEQDMIGLMSREFHDDTRYRGSHNAVATTWLVSFRQILETDKTAADLLNFISRIEPKAIPQSLLPKPKSQEWLVNAIGTLCAYAFLTRREEEDTFDMHSLVHMATRVWVDNQRIRGHTSQTALQHIYKVFPSNKYENRHQWREYMPHALCILQDTETFEMGERYGLSHQVGQILLTDGQTREAVRWLEEASNWRSKQFPEDHPSRLLSQHELARAYKANGQVGKAVELLENVVAVRVKTLVEDHPDLLASQHVLAQVYEANGQISDAIELLEHVVAVEGKTLAEDHPDRLASQHALARVYNADGRINKAVGLLEHVVGTEEKILAEDHPDRLASQHALARVYYADGQINKAVKLIEHVVAVEEKTLAGDHPDRLASQHVLAGVYEANGQISKAVELLEHVVAVEEKTLAEDHPDRLASQHALAQVYYADGQINKAVKLIEHVVAVEEKTLAGDHPDRLASQRALARVYNANGQISKAVELLEHVVEIERTTLEEYHPDRLSSQHELGRAYKANGQISKAVELLEHVVAVEGKTLAEDHPDRLVSQHVLAEVYEANGQISQAVELIEHVIKVREKTLAEDHPDRLASQQALAEVYKANGQISKAVELLEHVVAIEQKILTEDHPDRLSAQHALAGAYNANGQISKALGLIEHVVRVRGETLAGDHPDLLSSQQALAEVYKTNGRISKAVELLEHVVTARGKTLVEDHPDRLSSQHALAGAYISYGQVEKAVRLLENVVAMNEKVFTTTHPSRLLSLALLEKAKKYQI